MDFIPIARPIIGEEEAEAVLAQVRSGWISMGKRVEEFEAAVCRMTGARHAIAMCNGTATLHAALVAMGVGPGDEVVLPSLTYVSSANAVLYCGAKPVFCEVDPLTFNATTVTIEAALTPRTKVVMPVDLKGQPADFDAINTLAARHGLTVLADSAESFGAMYKGRLVGAQCAAHSFSFFANKNVTMGEGGVVTTDDADLAERCRVLRNQGQSERYVHVEIGFNYRLTDIAAAVGVQQMRRVEHIMRRKSEIARFYDDAFAGHPLIATPVVAPFCGRPSWYMYCLTFAPSVDRDRVLRLMAEQGVDHRLSFPPVHLQPVYRRLFGGKEGDLPVTEDVFRRFVDIPCFADMTDLQMRRVVEVVVQAVENSRR